MCCMVPFPKDHNAILALPLVAMKTDQYNTSQVCGNGHGAIDACYVVEGRVWDHHRRALLLQLLVSLGDAYIYGRLTANRTLWCSFHEAAIHIGLELGGPKVFWCHHAPVGNPSHGSVRKLIGLTQLALGKSHFDLLLTSIYGDWTFIVPSQENVTQNHAG